MKRSILESVLTLLSGDPTGPYIISADRRLQERKHTQRRPNSTVGTQRGMHALLERSIARDVLYMHDEQWMWPNYSKKHVTTDVEVTTHRMEDRQVY